MAMNYKHPLGDKVCVFDHFVDATAPLSTQDTSAAGSPTVARVSGAGGIFRLRADSQDEAQALGLNLGDVLVLDPTQGPVFECRLAVHGTLTGDERAVWGLAAARNATLDSVAKHAWFRVEGVSTSLLWETDDATTDDNDNDTGEDYTADTYNVYKIDMTDLSNVRFMIDGAEVATADLSTLAATDLLQPFIEYQKDGGADTNGLEIDYVLAYHAEGLDS